MATPAPSGDWSRTFRGRAVITHPQFIRSFLGRGALQGDAVSSDQGRSGGGMLISRRALRLEFDP